ncbi:DNA helicase [Ranunculus cassubicifolius]
MILIDDKNDRIHGRVMSREMTPQFEEILKEGELIEISKFGSSVVKRQWRVTDHSYQVYINRTSTVEPTTNTIDNIPTHGFTFIDYTNNISLGSRTKNIFLTDVIGKVTQWKTSKKTMVDKKIVEERELTIENEQGSRLNIILAEEFAHQIKDEDIYASAKIPILIISASVVKHNKATSEYYIESFSTTRLYLNLEIHETTAMMESVPDNNLEITETVQTSQTDLEDMIFKDRRTLTEINTAREKANANNYNTEFYTCPANIYKIYDHWDWYYQGCDECRKAVQPDMYGGYTCIACRKRTTNKYYICKLQADIEDGVTTTRITLFGNHLKSLLDKPIEEILNKSKEFGQANALNEIQKLINKNALFEIKIDKYNIQNKRSALTTNKILPIDPVLEEKYALRKRERDQMNTSTQEEQAQAKRSRGD